MCMFRSQAGRKQQTAANTTLQGCYFTDCWAILVHTQPHAGWILRRPTTLAPERTMFIFYAHAGFFNGSLCLENSQLPTLPCLPWIKALLLTSETAELFSSSPISSGAGEDRAIGWAHRRQMTQILSCPALVAPALVSWGKLINIKETMGGARLMETERTNRAREVRRNHSDEHNASSSPLCLRASSSPSAWWAGRAVPVRQH